MEEEINQTEEEGLENNVISWQTKEYVGAEKNKKWYIIASLVALALIIYAIITSNFIFAIIVVIAGVLTTFSSGMEPKTLEITLNNDGIKVGKEFYNYGQIDNFFIVYRPKEDVKNLYLAFKRFARPELEEPSKIIWLFWLLNLARTRISAPLEDANPLLIRNNLLKYLKEDTERTEIPLSEQLTKLFRM